MKTFKAFGQCTSSGNHIMDVNGYGPMIISINQWDDVDFYLSITTQDTNGWFNTSVVPSIAGVNQETAQAATDTLYNGTGAQLAFTHTVGAAGDMGNIYGADYIVPGTVLVEDAGSVAGDLRDTYGDGVLYYVDTGAAVGTIDYQNGYLNMTYPTGYAPGTGATAINMSCRTTTLISGYGSHLINVNTPLRDQMVRIIGVTPASALASCRLGLEVAFGW